jgi:hypothetical protein
MLNQDAASGAADRDRQSTQGDAGRHGLCGSLCCWARASPGAAAIDGGPEEVLRSPRALIGRLDLPSEPLSVIYARGFIHQYEPGRLYADPGRTLRSGWGVADRSVARLCAAVMTR